MDSFLLLLPRAILSDPVGTDYEQYIHDAHRHYQAWLDITSNFNWPAEYHYIDTAASSTHSYDSRPESDLHLDEVFTVSQRKSAEKRQTPCQFSQRLVLKSHDYEKSSDDSEVFDEGPFLRMLFQSLSNLPDRPYQINLQLTSIVSKLAMLPHPYLHEYLLNPALPTSRKTRTLFKTLQDIARRLTAAIPRVRNYKTLIENIRMQLMSEDPSYDESGEHNQLLESLIVVEEFCKELAAIAFVKYQHSIQMNR